MSETKYISLSEAAGEIGVNRSTMYYYIKQFDPPIKPKKFPLDKVAYITRAEFEKIKAAKKSAQQKDH